MLTELVISMDLGVLEADAGIQKERWLKPGPHRMLGGPEVVIMSAAH